MNTLVYHVKWVYKYIILMCLLLNVIFLPSQVPAWTSLTASVRYCPTTPRWHLPSPLSKAWKWRSSSNSSHTSIASVAINISCFLAAAWPFPSASGMVLTGILEPKAFSDKSVVAGVSESHPKLPPFVLIVVRGKKKKSHTSHSQ